MVQKTGLTAIILTLAGLIPFLVGAWGSLAPFQLAGIIGVEGGTSIISLWQMCLVALLVYGSAILSFMAGSRWGGGLESQLEYPPALTMFLSVLPSIWAFGCGVVGMYGLIEGDPMNGGVSIYPPAGLSMLAGGYFVLLAFDAYAGYPMGYMRMRIIATFVAMFSLVIPAWFAS